MGFLIGLVAMCVVFVLILPLMAFLYIDILETKHEAQAEIHKVEKLRKELQDMKGNP